MSEVNWIIPDKLASFNDDTFRAELGPRRCKLENGKPVVITPEQAAALPKEQTFIDWRGKHFPHAWKLYKSEADDSTTVGQRFVRVGSAETFDEVLAAVPQGG